MSHIPSRDEAWQLLKKYNSSEALLHHALAVEGVMRWFARSMAPENEPVWGVVGLLHDIDYEMYPEQHCKKCVELLSAADVDETVIRAITSHGYGLCSDVEPLCAMEKVLYAIDELTGLINAAAIMRPSRSVMDIELKSVKKKYKDKAFAAGVDRAVIQNGCDMLEMPLDEVITGCIMGMRDVAREIGLYGTPQA